MKNGQEIKEEYNFLQLKDGLFHQVAYYYHHHQLYYVVRAKIVGLIYI